MTPIAAVVVNGRAYAVRRFNPVETHRFYLAWITAHESGQAMHAIQLDGIRRCVAPDGTSLETDETINRYFTKYPADMFPLGGAAVIALLGEFAKEMKRYIADSGKLMTKYRGRQGRIPIPPGWESHAFFSRITDSGLCSYEKLLDESFPIVSLFEMLRHISWKDYCYHVVTEKAEAARKFKGSRK